MAQRTVNNPPFGWKTTGKIIDDLTELFSQDSNQYGFDLTGITDGSVILQDAVDSSVSGDSIILPNGIIRIDNQVNFDKKIKIIGSGTNILTDSNIKVFNIDSDFVSVENIDFINSGTRTADQYGIFVNSKNNFKIHNCSFDGFYHGVKFENTILTGNNKTSTISDCYFTINTYGILGGERGEYVNITGCRGYLNSNHIEFEGGNISVTSCIFTQGTNGINVMGGLNDSHGIISGCELNHISGNPLYFDGITKGMTVNACHVFQGNIYLKNCSGVSLTNCMFDVNNFLFEGAVGSKFTNNRHLTAYANTVDKSYNGVPVSVVIANDNYLIDGTSYTGL
jgi:hypothetical protein